MKNSILITLLLILTVDSCLGQDPNWGFNPNDYQYSMTFTAFLSVDGNRLTNPNDKVAAFIDDEIRGVSNVTYNEYNDKYVVYLTVFSNTNNKTITFKIYDSYSETTVDTETTATFTIDGNLGSMFQSYAIANTTLNTSSELLSFSFKGINETSVTISDSSVTISVPPLTDVTNLIAEFTLSEGANLYLDRTIQESGITSQNYSSVVFLNVLSEDESSLTEYEVLVEIEDVQSNIVVNLSTDTTSLINQNDVLVVLETSEAIDEVDFFYFQLENATIKSLEKKNETQFHIQLVALIEGDFSIQLLENVFLETTSKENEASNMLSFSLDTTKPYVKSIQIKSPAKIISNSNSLVFTVVFSEPVENVFSNSFLSVSNATITVAKDSEDTYFVTVSNIATYNGQVGLRLVASNSIKDRAGNYLRVASLKN